MCLSYPLFDLGDILGAPWPQLYLLFYHSILGLKLSWKAQLDSAGGVSLKLLGTVVAKE